MKKIMSLCINSMNSLTMYKLQSIDEFDTMTSADFDKLMGTNVNIQVFMNDEFKCYFCNSSDAMVSEPTEGIMVCTNCGRITETLDHTPEWKTFDDNQTSIRCGMPTNALLPQSSLGTDIGGACNMRFKTMQHWTAMPPQERSLNSVLNIIQSKCREMALSGCIIDDAKIMYKIASEYKKTETRKMIIRGKNKKGLMAACVFYACKRSSHIKTLKDIATAFGVKTSCVNKGCKNFDKYVKYKKENYSTNLSFPSQYIHQYCVFLKLDENTETIALNLAKNIEVNNLIRSHTPVSIAAACIMYAIQLNGNLESHTLLDKNVIANAFGISDVTLTKTFNKLMKNKEQLTNGKYVNALIQQQINSNPIDVPSNIAEKIQMMNDIDTLKYFNEIDIHITNYTEKSLYKYMSKCNKFIKELTLEI